MTSTPQPRRAARHASWLLALLLCLSAGSAAAQPTVNGWFHGDGDDSLYHPYSVS